MVEWRRTTWGDVITLQRGYDITKGEQALDGHVPVVSSGGVSSHHDQAISDGPGVVIGRKGTLGRVHFVDGPFWPHDTTLWVRDFKGNHPRFVYYALKAIDPAYLDVGSASPTLNRNHVHPIPVRWLDNPTEQRAIADVLGAFDDKIAANEKLASTALELARTQFSRLVRGSRVEPMSQVTDPVLGGTPSKSDESMWNGPVPWASAKDITSASNSVILSTTESITELAASKSRTRALPCGTVVLTARGTVGVVARLGIPAAINQSCYGFVPDLVPPGCLFFAVEDAASQARSLAHGSVFDTITMRTFDHVQMPTLSRSQWLSIEEVVEPLLSTSQQAVSESMTLASTRDELLPLLMSGKLRVRDAEKVVEEVT